MKQRCNNPKAINYKHYGGRGITVTSLWDKFAGFLRDMGERPDGHSIDRIDYNDDYTPENCRWLPKGEQNKNRRGWAQ
jgi:hypothetical protein